MCRMNRHSLYWLCFIAGMGLLLSLVIPNSPGIAADGEAGILVYPTAGLVTDENGGIASFYMELTSRPDTPVEIPLTSSNPAEGVPEVTIVKFTPGIWDRPQRVNVRGVADRISDGNISYTILTGPARSRDSQYNGMDAQDVSLINVNDAFPVAQDDQAQIQEDTSVEINVLGNDTSLDDQPLTLSIESAPQNGSAQAMGNQKFVYHPNGNFNGQDSFRYAVCDSDGDCASATVLVTVTPLDDRVTAHDDRAVTIVNTPVVIDVLENDISEDGDGELFVARHDSISRRGGLITRQGDRLNYQPLPGFIGNDEFEYTASNGNEEDRAKVKVEVKSSSESPVAGDDSFATGQMTVLTIPAPGVLENDSDPDGDPLQTTLVDSPDHGSLILNFDGSFTFTPNGTFVGIDTYTYTASDGSNQSNQATVSINIRDQINPVVSWVAPVENGGIYDVNSGTVQLEIETSDNVGVARVRFYRWDSVASEYIDIGEDLATPYQVSLSADSLNLTWNQVFVRSYDQAGNPSEQEFIWLYKTGQPVYLPLILH